jgi:hypothetical protein
MTSPQLNLAEPRKNETRRQALSRISGQNSVSALKVWVRNRCNPSDLPDTRYLRVTFEDLCDPACTPYKIFFHVLALIENGGSPELIQQAYTRRIIDNDLRRLLQELLEAMSEGDSTRNLPRQQEETKSTQSLGGTAGADARLSREIAGQTSRFTFNPTAEPWVPKTLDSTESMNTAPPQSSERR